ncbi:hypothetical protein Nepgr_021563 [Nepenthes gracilis]|uniref:Growth-regulating factor n=1 Tax=Nepenthes gracilis TaxID=150966 RepID=A0AAD3XW18_NEPGR|nr:hypothetical protein Nepgr_021563 [Nepenthes gracilis]
MRGECSSSNGGGIGVSSKASVDDGKFLVVELGLKLEEDDGHNQKLDGDPPFLSNQSGSDGARVTFDKLGTAYLSEIRDGDAAATATAVTASSVGSGGDGAGDGSVAAVRSPLQPFDISNTGYCFFESPGRMATTLRFPFTAAQWKELHRQAMIYKYMVASVPVPHDLLFPSPTNFSDPSATTSSWGKVSMLNLRWTGKNSKDAEPGRCKRTDGKKWRCSRDVAPNQKYCERHLNRGRPRSRKPVESHVEFPINQTKISAANKTQKSVSNPSNSKLDINGSASKSQCIRGLNTHHESKPSPFELVVSVPPSNERSRSSDWVIKDQGVEQQRRQVELKTMKLATDGSFCSTNSSIPQQDFGDESLNFSSFVDFNSNKHKSDVHNCCPFPNSTASRGFINAWSSALLENTHNSNGNESSNVKLSSSSLALSMAAGDVIHEEMCRIQMGLGVVDSDCNSGDDVKNQIASWLISPNPGGPLAEVLGPKPTTVTGTAPDLSCPDAGNVDLVTPPATTVSSASGFRGKTLPSLSDSSGSNSTIQSQKQRSHLRGSVEVVK